MQQPFTNLQRAEGTYNLPELLRPLGSFEHLFWLMDQSHPVHQ